MGSSLSKEQDSREDVCAFPCADSRVQAQAAPLLLAQRTEPQSVFGPSKDRTSKVGSCSSAVRNRRGPSATKKILSLVPWIRSCQGRHTLHLCLGFERPDVPLVDNQKHQWLLPPAPLPPALLLPAPLPPALLSSLL